MALLDVRKEINFCKKVGVPIIGIIENMSVLVCPKCNKLSNIFPPVQNGVTGVARDMQVPYLGSIPLDPLVGMCCDKGKSLLKKYPSSPATVAYRNIAKLVEDYCSSNDL